MISFPLHPFHAYSVFVADVNNYSDRSTSLILWFLLLDIRSNAHKSLFCLRILYCFWVSLPRTTASKFSASPQTPQSSSRQTSLSALGPRPCKSGPHSPYRTFLQGPRVPLPFSGPRKGPDQISRIWDKHVSSQDRLPFFFYFDVPAEYQLRTGGP